MFGRAFPLISVSRSPEQEAHAFVSYQGHMVLQIPLRSTDLSLLTGKNPCLQLTLASIEELINLAKECEELCPVPLKQFGTNCQ